MRYRTPVAEWTLTRVHFIGACFDLIIQVISSLTFFIGPTSGLDAYWRTSNSRTVRRSDLSQEFHVYGIEWSKNYLYTYIDSKLQQVLYMPFTGYSMWQRGEFASQTVNNTVLVDPWSSTGNLNTPFDQEFYLILNVAVGSRNGWFA